MVGILGVALDAFHLANYRSSTDLPGLDCHSRPGRRQLVHLLVDALRPLEAHQPCVGTLSRCAHVAECQDNYPEMSARLIICRAPSWVAALWRWVRVMLSEVTAAKVNILGSGTSAAEALSQYADLANVPRELGGTCDKCPEGCSNSDRGPWDTAKTLRR